MVSKNNHYSHIKQVPHYGLRKLSIGVASVLLSTTVYLGFSNGQVFADTANSGNAVDTTQTTDSKQSQGQTTVTLSDAASLSPVAADQLGVSLAASDAVANVPEATHNVNSVFSQSTVSNIKVQEIPGTVDSSNIATAGTTQLSFDFNLTADQAASLKSGDYIDIQMGIPYTVTANGQVERLSYGRDVQQTTPVEVYSDKGNLIGYIVPVDDTNSYIGTTNASTDNSLTPQWIGVQKNNVDAVNDLGATNGYYRLVFVDNISKYGAVSAKIEKVNWYNAFTNSESTKPSLKTSSFTLYSSDSSINSYSPQNDVVVGSTTATSGLSVAVTHADPAVQLNTDSELKPNTSTKTAAHWWYQRDDGTYVLGYNSIADPSQSEGVSLTNKVGNDFNITVTKPDDNNKVSYYFADDDQVQKDLARTIVGDSNTEAVDPIVGESNLSIGKQTVVSKPTVSVTSTTNGNTKTYHIHIDGNYAGFKHDTNGNSSYASTITLLSWVPKEPTDLLPPAGSGITSNDNDADDAIEQTYHTQHVGGVMVNHDLINALEANPWHVEITDNNGQKIPLNGVSDDNAAGYYFMKNPELILHAPSNYGYGVGNYGQTQQKVNKQIIHYWYNQIGGTPAASDTVRTITFNSNDNGATWYNSTSPETGHYNEGAFYNVTVPNIQGYTAYGNNNYTTTEYEQNPTLSGVPTVTEIGFQGYYSPTNYTSQATYNQSEDALVVNVVYKADEQRLNYQVILEDANGNTIKTVINPTKLATGASDSALSDSTKTDWNNLLSQYASYQDGDQEYTLVTADSTQTGLNKTDSLPATFDHDSSVDQLVTIYLAPKPVENGTVTIHYMDEGVNPTKTSFTPHDGNELTAHQQNKTDTVGNPYSNKLWDYASEGYTLISADDGAKSGTITQTPQNFYVYLKHTTTPRSDSKTVTETIHYVYANGPKANTQAADDYTSELKFARNGYHDATDKKDHWNDWTPASGTFAAVVSPKIADYYVDQPTVNAIYGITPNSANVVKTVYYHQQILDVKYIDDVTGQVLMTVSKSGANNADAGYSTPADIQNFENQGYTLVSDNTNGKELYFDNDDNVDQHYEVHLTHGSDIQPETKTVKETIHYVYENGPHAGEQAAPDYTASRSFVRTNTVDSVTGAVTKYGDWNAVDPFAAVTSPLINHYTADQLVIPEYAVDANSADIEKTVYYKMDEPKTPGNTPDTPGTTPDNPGTTPDNPGVTPDTPDVTPGTPSTTPGQPNQTSDQSDHPTVVTSTNGDSAQPASQTAQLPQTGNHSTLGLIGLGLAAMAASFGLVDKKKKN